MIKLSGTLTIRRITGRHGPFNVGRLATEIGEFAVKDTLIEEYDEGRYEGDFGVTDIYPAHYVAGGRLVIEVRAKLAAISLVGIDTLSPDASEPMAEPDPIDEPPIPVAQLAGAGAAETTDAGDGPEPVEPDEETRLADLFGELWPLAPELKLDPTVDRARFRRQRDALKELGYRFQPVGQTWTRSAAPAAA